MGAFVVVTSQDRSTVLALPTEEPRGLAEITSFGLAEARVDRRPPIAVLHVRMTMTNVADDVPWSFDLTDATVGVGHEPRVHALFINSDIATLPLAILARGQRRTVDFYFPAAPAPADFDFAWRFKAGIRLVATHTRFVRDDATSQPVDIVPQEGWGASWWIDSSNPRLIYYGLGLTPRPKSIIVTRSRQSYAYRVQSVWL